MAAPDAPRTTYPSPGSIVGDRYELLEELGRGAFGAVYRARHVHTQRPAAVKVLHATLHDDEGARVRFLREVQAPAAIDHPGIAEVLDADVDEAGVAFVAMEMLDGETLRHSLRRGGTADAALDDVEEVLDALAAAHDAGFVHRDLKPANVMVTTRGGERRLVILDFGLARREGGDMVTASGTSLGTPRYMAPEQFKSARDAGPSADVWSVGVLLYEILGGRPPFKAVGGHALMMKVVTEAHVPLQALATRVPTPLADVVESCLQKEPGYRPPDARTLLTALRRARRETGPLGDATYPLLGDPEDSGRTTGPIEEPGAWARTDREQTGPFPGQRRDAPSRAPRVSQAPNGMLWVGVALALVVAFGAGAVVAAAVAVFLLAG